MALDKLQQNMVQFLKIAECVTIQAGQAVKREARTIWDEGLFKYGARRVDQLTSFIENKELAALTNKVIKAAPFALVQILVPSAVIVPINLTYLIMHMINSAPPFGVAAHKHIANGVGANYVLQAVKIVSKAIKTLTPRLALPALIPLFIAGIAFETAKNAEKIEQQKA